MTGGEVTLEGVNAETFDAALSVLRAVVPGVDVHRQAAIFRNGERLQVNQCGEPASRVSDRSSA